MVFLPVVERELRVVARRPGTYRTRVVVVLAMVAAFAWHMLGWDKSGLTASQQGEMLFTTLTIVAFIFAALIGVIVTSDCVSAEKREGTLGLLFLTDLKGYDVVFGKLAGNSVNVLYGLLSFLPVLGVPLLLGGITLEQLLKSELALLGMIFLSLSAGIYVSTCSRNERKAMFFTILIVAAIIFLPLLLMLWLTETNFFLQDDVWQGLIFCPGFPLAVAADPSFPRTWPADVYWYSIPWPWLFALAFLTRASRKIARSWDDAKPVRQNRLAVLLQRRMPVPRRSIGGNPFTWLALRGETKVQMIWFFVGSLFAMWLTGLLSLGRFMFDRGVVVATMFVLHGFLKYWMAGEASRRFIEDRRHNAFELLLSTSLNERQIIRGQWQALLQQFGPPIAFIVVWEIFMLSVAGTGKPWQSDEHLFGQEVAMICFLPADFVALSWLGMWLGLKIKGRAFAITLALAAVLLLPWLLSYLIFALLDHSNSSLNAGDFISGCGIFFGVIIDVILITWARYKLFKNFRRLATEGHGRPGT